jgi:hypothetical protein
MEQFVSPASKQLSAAFRAGELLMVCEPLTFVSGLEIGYTRALVDALKQRR